MSDQLRGVRESFRSLLRRVEADKRKNSQSERSNAVRELDLQFIYGHNNYRFIWNDSGTGTDLVGSAWRPNVPAGWFSVGDLFTSIREYPSASRVEPLVLVRPTDLGQTALCPPKEFSLVWADHNSGGDYDMSVWKPVAPEGYTAIGYVVQQGYKRPTPKTRPDFACVRTDLLEPASSSFVFNDRNSGVSGDIGIWTVRGNATSTVPAGGFVATRSFTAPPAQGVEFAIKAECALLDGVAYEDVCDPVGVQPDAAIDVRQLMGKGDLQFKWNSEGAGCDSVLDFYDVKPASLPEGYYSLGSGGRPHEDPGRDWSLMIFKDLVEGDKPALAEPDDLKLIWEDKGSGASHHGSFWKMVPPAGYVAVGFIAQSGYNMPDPSLHRCLREDLAAEGAVCEKPAWNDKHSGVAGDFSAWNTRALAPAAMQTDTLVGHGYYATYSHRVYCPNAAYCTGAHGRHGLVDTNGKLLTELFDKPLFDVKQLGRDDLTLELEIVGLGEETDLAAYGLNKEMREQGFVNIGHYGSSTLPPRRAMANALAIRPLPGFAGLLQHPIAFRDLHSDGLWEPIAPAGYVSLGIIAHEGEPDADSVWCVQQDVVIGALRGAGVYSDGDFSLHLAKADLPILRNSACDTPEPLGTMLASSMPTFVPRSVHCQGDVAPEPPPQANLAVDAELEAVVATEYKRVWDDSGAGGESHGSFFNPVLPSGFSFLGTTGAPGYSKPLISELRSVIVRQVSDEGDALAKPIRFEYMHSVPGNPGRGMFWQPIAPEGYVAMGILVTGNQENPDPEKSNYRCVRRDLVYRGDLGDYVWNDRETGTGGDIAIFRSKSRWGTRCVGAGTLSAVRHYERPLDGVAWTLEVAALTTNQDPLTSSTEEALIRKHGPQITYHPNEKYLPLDIDSMLSEVDLKVGDQILSDVTRDLLEANPNGQLQLKEGADRGGDLQSAKAYVHVRQGVLFLDMQFWTLHAYNGAGKVEVSSTMAGIPATTESKVVAPLGEHEGDWETVILRFANTGNTGKEPPLIEVGFVAHGETHWVDATKVKRSVEGGPVVSYSSLNGHGAYPNTGPNYSSQGNLIGLVSWRLINQCAHGKVLDTRKNYEIAARSKYGDSIETEFCDSAFLFSGRWGKSDEATIKSEDLVHFAWKALWPLVLTVVLAMSTVLWFVPPLGLFLTVASMSALTVAFPDEVLKSLGARIVEDQDGPRAPKTQGAWNSSNSF